MPAKVFSNAVILEGDELEVVRGYLVVRDGEIERIAEGSPPRRAVDLKGGFILPPFVNAHTHVADSVAKDLYSGRRQPEVVGPGGIKFEALASSGDEEVIKAIRATMRDMLRTGTLAHCDFREGGLRGVELLRRARNPMLDTVILGRPSSLAELDGILSASHGIGLPSLDAFDRASLEELSKRTRERNKLLAVHAAETAWGGSSEGAGRSEIERALELHPTFVVHATWGSEQDLIELKRSEVPVVFCPRANSLLSTGVPPIGLALADGLTLCLGTDNATVCQPNMFEELAYAWATLRRADGGAGDQEARALLRAATIAPLSIFNLPWGPIQEGNPATFIVLARGNNLLNLTDVHVGLVNRARADNLRAICRDGEYHVLRGDRPVALRPGRFKGSSAALVKKPGSKV